MSVIRISDSETLDIEAIRSYKSSYSGSETVLTITKGDGETVTLCGPKADAALMTLLLHGC